ncbi:hypothetical protein SNE40_010691 [Patella caerulea]|uniref:Transposase n=1 Tax=Patella caerulea TaxID=87958 RepID=A0AAN8Q0J8_PATCE
MPRLTEGQRQRALGMLNMGATHVHVARTFGCSRVTVGNLVQRFRQTGRTSDRSRTGRPRVRYFRTRHLRNRFLTVTSSARNALGRRVSPQTVARRLRTGGIRASRPFKGQLLTPENRRRRRRWANTVRRWQRRQWQRVVFSDESQFCLFRVDGRQRVYRRRGERTAACCVREVVPYSGGSVMVLGGICGNQKTPLIVINGNLNAQRYRDEILRPVVLPYPQQQPVGVLFQHDKARPHTARIVQDFLAANNVNVLPWPACSPDLSPIEHLWDRLDRQVRARQHVPANRQELIQALQEEWNHLPPDPIRRLTSSVRRRIMACIAAQGGHMRY